MTLKELMQGFKPNPDFEGIIQAEDYVLAVSFAERGAHPDTFLVAQEGITEHAGSLNPESSDSRYMRSGKSSSKTGNQRKFSVSGDRFAGDPFQEEMHDHAMKYGTGSTVQKEYVHFCLLTGKGEKGICSILMEEDAAGSAGANSSFKATLSTSKNPDKYLYAALPDEPEDPEG